MREMRWPLTASVLFIGLVFWLGPYRYEQWVDKNLVRINRLTGAADRLTTSGWVRLHQNNSIGAVIREIFPEYAALDDTNLHALLESKKPGYRKHRTANGYRLEDVSNDPDFMWASRAEKRKFLERFLALGTPKRNPVERSISARNSQTATEARHQQGAERRRVRIERD
jgi:hypothetical protein